MVALADAVVAEEVEEVSRLILPDLQPAQAHALTDTSRLWRRWRRLLSYGLNADSNERWSWLYPCNGLSINSLRVHMM